MIGTLLLGAVAAWVGMATYNAKGPLAATADVVVPRASMDTLAVFLEANRLINNATSFRIATLITRRNGPLKSGEFRFPAEGSLRDVLAVLRQGKPVQHRVTIPEGLTAAQVAVIVERADALDGPTEVPAEGSVLPETYSYVRGTMREVLLKRGAAAMSHTLESLWDARVPGLPLANPHEAVVLASIVERETAKPEERARIAAVFLARLRRGMKLQSDPTVAYAAAGGLGALDHGLTRSELERDDPYNTYRIAGLPPDPICMPGLASLRAVLLPWPAPAGGDELFFVADGSGGHVFARTEEEHSRNVARWREMERIKATARPAGAN